MPRRPCLICDRSGEGPMGPMSPLGPGMPGGPICPGGPEEPLGPGLPERNIKIDRFKEEWCWEKNGEIKQKNKQNIDKTHLKAQVALEVQVRTSAPSSSFHWSSVYWPLCCSATRRSDESKTHRSFRDSVSPTIDRTRQDWTETWHEQFIFWFRSSKEQRTQDLQSVLQEQ